MAYFRVPERAYEVLRDALRDLKATGIDPGMVPDARVASIVYAVASALELHNDVLVEVPPMRLTFTDVAGDQESRVFACDGAWQEFVPGELAKTVRVQLGRVL